MNSNLVTNNPVSGVVNLRNSSLLRSIPALATKLLAANLFRPDLISAS